MAYIHQIPKAFQSAVELVQTEPGSICDDCRQEMPTYRPHIFFQKQEHLCLTCGRERGLVVAVRRPKAS